MDHGDKIMAGIGGYVKAIFKVQVGCVILPICHCRMGKERRTIVYTLDCIENKGIK